MSISSESKVIKAIQSDEKPTSYFNLVERVGDSGKYQLIVMFIFLITWFVTGIILMSTAFLFQNREFNCEEYGLLTKDCDGFVCALPENQWQLYIDSNGKSFESLATDFEPYLCNNAGIIDLLSSSTYLGAFVGYIFISFFSDNFGRRSSMILSWGITCCGALLVTFSVNIYMASVGMFFSGAGGDAAINICFFFFSEIVGDKKRQQYSVLVQVLFTLGAMVSTLLFYLIDNWRVVWTIGATGPALIGLILLLIYVEQTPQFLIKQGINKTLKAMNRIGKINLDRKQTLDEEDIQNVINNQMNEQFTGKLVTPLDLIRFPSLRVITISCSIISFMTYAMYYGPTLIINDIGFNIYISSFMVQLSQLVIFLPSYLYIEQIERRKFGIILYFVAVAMALLLVFIEKPQDCDLCIESILELIIVFIFRGSVSFFFCFFQLYTCQLYPSRARGIGVGIVSAIGTLASTSSPIYLGYLRRKDINVMTFFVLFGIIAIGCLTILTETKGLILKQEIEEIELEKQKKRSQISIKRSKISQAEKSQLTYDHYKPKNSDRVVLSSYD